MFLYIVFVVYSVCNENNNCDEAIVTIQVNELHTLPIAVNDTLTVNEDGFLLGSVAVNDSDADGDDLIFTLEIDVAFGTLVLNADGTFTYTPSPHLPTPPALISSALTLSFILFAMTMAIAIWLL